MLLRDVLEVFMSQNSDADLSQLSQMSFDEKDKIIRMAIGVAKKKN